MRATTNEFTRVRPTMARMDHGAATRWPARVRRLAGAAGIALGVLLSACGGGGDHQARQVPAITTQPADASVVEGSAAGFAVTAVGAATLTYQWASSSDGGATFVAIANATAASYSTGATTEAQSGTRYRVVVANDLGSVTSSSVTLTVTNAIVAPTITVQPADAVVTAPNTANFHVTAAGTSPSYAWQSSADGTTFAAVSGAADSPSLTITDTTTSLSGHRYRVVVSNGAGRVTSAAALLTVGPTPAAPAFTTQPLSQSVFSGMAADFVVVATGVPTPTVRWKMNGANLVDGAQTGTCAGATVSGSATVTLSLGTIPLSCSGAIFSAVASNGVAPDAVSADATLTVSLVPAAPVVTTQPASVSVPVGSTATFTAAATGVPTPTVQWQTGSDGIHFSNIVGATTGSYTTPSIDASYDGLKFRAVFSNGSGSVPSQAATLTVSAPPAAGLSLLAGDIGGNGTLDGNGTAARFFNPFGMAFDASGNMYVVDTDNSTIRKINPMGVVSTVAGTSGTYGFADGAGTAAQFNAPEAIAVDRATGNVYVSDTGNNMIRKVTPMGVVSTFAGTGEEGSADGAGTAATFLAPAGLTVDAAGNLFVADSGNSTIRKITPAGVVSTVAGLAQNEGSTDGPVAMARFSLPFGVAIDSAGNLYVSEIVNATIRKITPAGSVSTLAGTAGNQGSDDGTGAAASFWLPAGIAVDPMGFLYVADANADTIRIITPAGAVSTLAGAPLADGSTDGGAHAARFFLPVGVALDSAGALYIADAQNSTIRKLAAGLVSTIAGQAMQTGSDDGSGAAVRFNSPLGIAADAAGNVYVADYGNDVVRKITPASVTSTVAGVALSRGSADGSGSAARFASDAGIAVDSAGNLYVSDTDNHTIRKITPAGVVSTLAGTAGNESYADGTGAAAAFDHPAGVAVDSAGNVYVADQFNSVIRKITPAGIVSTLAGQAGTFGSADGSGPMASFNQPTGVAVDGAGNVYVADYANSSIRKITPAGVVTTLAGGSFGSADGSGSAASFNAPQGIAIDAAGNLFVADTGNSTIRKVTPAGLVTTVLGVTGEAGIRLGNDPRLYRPIAIAILGSNIAISTQSAIVVAALP